MTGKTIAELSEGDHAELTRVVEQADVEQILDRPQQEYTRGLMAAIPRGYRAA